MVFQRDFDDDSIKKLREEPLFKERGYLKDDCLNGNVFPAIRKNRIDFYYQGGKLFSWDNTGSFKTHHKYASVLCYKNGMPYVQSSKDNGYVKQSELANLHLIPDFFRGYERIKENCALYSGLEDEGIALLYKKFSCVKNNRSDVVILDIEIAFSNRYSDDDIKNCKRRSRNIIDFVSIDKSGTLRFFEAKH